MENNVQFEERDGYLRCHVTGTDSLAFSIGYFRSVAEECRKRGFTKALIVEELEGQLRTLDLYTLVEQLPELFQGIKLAFVDTVLDHRQGNLFGETVGINRAMHGKVCADEQEAVNWLMNSS